MRHFMLCLYLTLAKQTRCLRAEGGGEKKNMKRKGGGKYVSKYF